MRHGSAISHPNDSGRIPLILRLSGIVERTLPRPCHHLLEYQQLQASIASQRSVTAASALERLVGRCWDDLDIRSRARLLALALTLRAGLRAESDRKVKAR